MVYYKDNDMNMRKNIFGLVDDELIEIQNTNKLPKDITLEGIEEHKLFKKIFEVRTEPSKIAGIILNDRNGHKPITYKYESVIPLDIRRKKLELKEIELQIQKERIKKNTEVWKKICDMEDKINKIYDILAGFSRKV